MEYVERPEPFVSTAAGYTSKALSVSTYQPKSVIDSDRYGVDDSIRITGKHMNSDLWQPTAPARNALTKPH